MNTINEKIADVRDGNISWMTQRAFDAGFVLGFFKDKVIQFEEETKCDKLTVTEGILRLRGATRDELVAFIRVFGGKWEKEVSTFYPDKIDYNQKIPHPFIPNEFVEVRATESDPPPSCKIVEVEELVPAQVRKVKKIQCKEPVEEPEGVVEAPKQEEEVLS